MKATSFDSRFRKNGSGTKIILGCASSVIALACASPALAQDNAPDTEEGVEYEDTIIVTGLRGSLQRNLDEKRDASGVVGADRVMM